MKKIFLSLIGAAALLVTPSWAAAQDSQAAIVHVPFKFIVGDRLMPAGDYRISPQTSDWSVLTIASMRGDAIAAFASSEGAPNPDPENQNARVWFNNYFGQYFLKQVAVPGRDARVVAVTKAQAERTLARLNLLPAERATPAK